MATLANFNHLEDDSDSDWDSDSDNNNSGAELEEGQLTPEELAKAGKERKLLRFARAMEKKIANLPAPLPLPFDHLLGPPPIIAPKVPHQQVYGTETNPILNVELPTALPVFDETEYQRRCMMAEVDPALPAESIQTSYMEVRWATEDGRVKEQIRCDRMTPNPYAVRIVDEFTLPFVPEAPAPAQPGYWEPPVVVEGLEKVLEAGNAINFVLPDQPGIPHLAAATTNMAECLRRSQDLSLSSELRAKYLRVYKYLRRLQELYISVDWVNGDETAGFCSGTKDLMVWAKKEGIAFSVYDPVKGKDVPLHPYALLIQLFGGKGNAKGTGSHSTGSTFTAMGTDGIFGPARSTRKPQLKCADGSTPDLPERLVLYLAMEYLLRLTEQHRLIGELCLALGEILLGSAQRRAMRFNGFIVSVAGVGVPKNVYTYTVQENISRAVPPATLETAAENPHATVAGGIGYLVGGRHVDGKDAPAFVTFFFDVSYAYDHLDPLFPTSPGSINFLSIGYKVVGATDASGPVVSLFSGLLPHVGTPVTAAPGANNFEYTIFGFTLQRQMRLGLVAYPNRSAALGKAAITRHALSFLTDPKFRGTGLGVSLTSYEEGGHVALASRKHVEYVVGVGEAHEKKDKVMLSTAQELDSRKFTKRQEAKRNPLFVWGGRALGAWRTQDVGPANPGPVDALGQEEETPEEARVADDELWPNSPIPSAPSIAAARKLWQGYVTSVLNLMGNNPFADEFPFDRDDFHLPEYATELEHLRQYLAVVNKSWIGFRNERRASPAWIKASIQLRAKVVAKRLNATEEQLNDPALWGSSTLEQELAAAAGGQADKEDDVEGWTTSDTTNSPSSALRKRGATSAADSLPSKRPRAPPKHADAQQQARQGHTRKTLTSAQKAKARRKVDLAGPISNVSAMSAAHPRQTRQAVLLASLVDTEQARYQESFLTPCRVGSRPATPVPSAATAPFGRPPTPDPDELIRSTTLAVAPPLPASHYSPETLAVMHQYFTQSLDLRWFQQVVFRHRQEIVDTHRTMSKGSVYTSNFGGYQPNTDAGVSHEINAIRNAQGWASAVSHTLLARGTMTEQGYVANEAIGTALSRLGHWIAKDEAALCVSLVDQITSAANVGWSTDIWLEQANLFLGMCTDHSLTGTDFLISPALVESLLGPATAQPYPYLTIPLIHHGLLAGDKSRTVDSSHTWTSANWKDYRGRFVSLVLERVAFAPIIGATLPDDYRVVVLNLRRRAQAAKLISDAFDNTLVFRLGPIQQILFDAGQTTSSHSALRSLPKDTANGIGWVQAGIQEFVREEHRAALRDLHAMEWTLNDARYEAGCVGLAELWDVAVESCAQEVDRGLNELQRAIEQEEAEEDVAEGPGAMVVYGAGRNTKKKKQRGQRKSHVKKLTLGPSNTTATIIDEHPPRTASVSLAPIFQILESSDRCMKDGAVVPPAQRPRVAVAPAYEDKIEDLPDNFCCARDAAPSLYKMNAAIDGHLASLDPLDPAASRLSPRRIRDVVFNVLVFRLATYGMNELIRWYPSPDHYRTAWDAILANNAVITERYQAHRDHNVLTTGPNSADTVKTLNDWREQHCPDLDPYVATLNQTMYGTPEQNRNEVVPALWVLAQELVDTSTWTETGSLPWTTVRSNIERVKRDKINVVDKDGNRLPPKTPSGRALQAADDATPEAEVKWNLGPLRLHLILSDLVKHGMIDEPSPADMASLIFSADAGAKRGLIGIARRPILTAQACIDVFGSLLTHFRTLANHARTDEHTKHLIRFSRLDTPTGLEHMLCKISRGLRAGCLDPDNLPKGVSRRAAEWTIFSDEPIIEVDRNGAEE